MATSIFRAQEAIGAATGHANNRAIMFFQTYAKELAKGRSHYIEPQAAKGIIRTFLLKVSCRKQKDLVKERTVRKNGQLALMPDNKRLFTIEPSLKSTLSGFVNDWM